MTNPDFLFGVHHTPQLAWTRQSTAQANWHVVPLPLAHVWESDSV